MPKNSSPAPFEVGSIADLKTQLRGLFKAPRVPVMLWGPTGVGKTPAVDQLTAEFQVLSGTAKPKNIDTPEPA